MARAAQSMLRPLACAHDWVARVLPEGGRAVDATAGNGHDSLFLARCVGAAGHVYAFDIQPQALEATRLRLTREGVEARVSLHACSHARMKDAVDGGVHAVMFNLGYLPGSDHAMKTTKEETIPALQAALDLLAPGGLLTVMCYPGHDGGADECRAVVDLLEALPLAEWRVCALHSANGSMDAPFLMAALKEGVPAWRGVEA